MEEVSTVEDRWLYLLKHAGVAKSLPDFNDDIIAKAIYRLLVNRASERLIMDQANDMVWTEEELDRLALYKIRARERFRTQGLAEGRAEGLAEGRAEGRAEGLAEGVSQNQTDTKAILRDMGVSEEQIAELQTRLEALQQSRQAQK